MINVRVSQEEFDQLVELMRPASNTQLRNWLPTNTDGEIVDLKMFVGDQAILCIEPIPLNKHGDPVWSKDVDPGLQEMRRRSHQEALNGYIQVKREARDGFRAIVNGELPEAEGCDTAHRLQRLKDLAATERMAEKYLAQLVCALVEDNRYDLKVEIGSLEGAMED